MKNNLWKTWARALGEKASKHKHEADAVAAIRTLIFLSYLTTNAFIIAGVARHWNDAVCAPPPTARGAENRR
ncbi:MAG: hypothetical protein FJ275_00530 [Planctomycetes bacterium]|nr:hypothetical protein [Planctomycetota bacterium]